MVNSFWVRFPLTAILTFMLVNLIVDSVVIIIGVMINPEIWSDLEDFITRRVPGVIPEVLGLAWFWLFLFSIISAFAHCMWKSIRTNLVQSLLFAGALSLALYAVGVGRGQLLYGQDWGVLEMTWVKFGWIPAVIAAIGTHWVLYRVFRIWDR